MSVSGVLQVLVHGIDEEGGHLTRENSRIGGPPHPSDADRRFILRLLREGRMDDPGRSVRTDFQPLNSAGGVRMFGP
jgi:hypothetical protein